MCTTVLVELADFIRDLLPSLPDDALSIPKETLDYTKSALDRLLNSATDLQMQHGPLANPIAEAVVGIINTVVQSYKYKAHLSRCREQQSDESGYMVDAGLYLEDEVPSTETTDWSRCRFLIEFGLDKSYDPWDDNSRLSESLSVTRARIRAELMSHAHKVFLYQHRTALYSLIIFGDHFRAARWDRSGVIVSRKVNYLEDTAALLQLVVRFVTLDEESQGIDSTAKLIPPRTAAFRIMDDLAQANSDDMDYMEPGTANYVPPPAHPPKAEDLPPAASTAAPDAIAVSTPPRPEHGTPQDFRAREASAKGQAATQELADDSANDPPEDPDPDLAGMGTWADNSKRIFRYVRDRFRESLVPDWPRYKLKIQYKGKAHIFLVAKPAFQSSAMFGRATRGYVAVDAETGSFVFLKDCWRPSYEGAKSEGNYLETFAGDDDIIVPQVLCHSDVGGQCAFTAQYKELLKRREAGRCRATGQSIPPSGSPADQTVNKKRPLSADDDDDKKTDGPSSTRDPKPVDVNRSSRQHRHYRIAVTDVCLPFQEFRTAWQLIRLMYDCIRTHQQVYRKFGLLHGDISAGNVLIMPRLMLASNGEEVVRWCGALTDWELARPYLKDRTLESAKQPAPIGTWQFMSVAYVDSQWTQPVSVADELESFFHVMLFYAVRFLPHNVRNTTQFVAEYFDGYQTDIQNRHHRQCSVAKRRAVMNGILRADNWSIFFWKPDWCTFNPLNRLIIELLSTFKARYAMLEKAALLKQQASEGNAVSAASCGLKAPTPSQFRILRSRSLAQRHKTESVATRQSTGDNTESNAKQVAERLSDHEWVLDLLISEINEDAIEKWFDTGVVQDQLVDSCEPGSS